MPDPARRVSRGRDPLGASASHPDRKQDSRCCLRMILFALGDGVFLSLAGAATTLTMWSVHQTDWAFACASLAGMVAAMLVQAVLSWCVTPLLGSIESTVPAMVLAMLSPMSVCVLHMMGCELRWRDAAALGTGWGLFLSAWLQVHGYGVRRSLRRAHETGYS